MTGSAITHGAGEWRQSVSDNSLPRWWTLRTRQQYSRRLPPAFSGLVPKPRDACTCLPEPVRKSPGAGLTEAGAGRMTFGGAAPGAGGQNTSRTVNWKLRLPSSPTVPRTRPKVLVPTTADGLLKLG